MKLELKHLLSYADKELFGVEYNGGELHKLINIDLVRGYFIWKNLERNISNRIDCKPILRPLDLTKPITHNGETFVPIDKLKKDFGFDYRITMDGRFKDDFGDYYSATELGYNIVEKLLEWKFDIFSLTPNGLAEPVTDYLNPYK